MKTQLLILSICIILTTTSTYSYSSVAGVHDCGKRVPSKTKPTPTESEYDYYRNAKIAAVSGDSGNRIFQNNEGLLPSKGKGEVYYEYYLGIGGDNSPGSHRAVLLVQPAKNKRKLLERYYTQDHYASFCKLKN